MTRRPRLVLFAPHFAEYVCRLALGLSEQADVLLFVDRRNLAQECEPDFVAKVERAVRLKRFGSIGFSERARALADVVARTTLFRPDVFHIQEQPDKLTAFVARYAGRFHRLLLTVHDPNPHTGSDSVYARESRRFRDVIRAQCHGFHVHGDYCARALAESLDDRRPILSTPHGVLMVPEDGERLAAEKGRILMFGRMEAYKGIETLLDAIDILNRRGIAYRLVMAGRGPELDRLRHRIGSAPSIEVVEGFIEAADVRRQIARASVLAAPYLDATQSGVVSAAFGGGRPVVASRAGGLSDAVRDGVDGLLVTPGRADELADALERVIADEALQRRLSAGASNAAAGPFDWRHIAAQMLDFQRARLADAV